VDRLQGSEPEAVPIKIIGRLRNQNGPNQYIIVARMPAKAKITNVAGGVSGSRYLSTSKVGGGGPCICGITPIELMLEINDPGKSRPKDAHTPDKGARQYRGRRRDLGSTRAGGRPGHADAAYGYPYGSGARWFQVAFRLEA
jgi:hypothetical protein